MIVADTNLVAYLLIDSDFTAIAESVYLKESHWIAPPLWRSEFRNVLMLYVRRKILSLTEAKEAMFEAEAFMEEELIIDSNFSILELASEIGISAYDAEYVYLANLHQIPLVTGDRKIINSYTRAISFQDFLVP